MYWEWSVSENQKNLSFKIDWANLIVGRKFTVFAFFYFVFESNFQVQAPAGYIWRGDLTKGFLRYDFGGLIFGGAYTWRRLFSELYGIFQDELQARISLKAFFFTNNVITIFQSVLFLVAVRKCLNTFLVLYQVRWIVSNLTNVRKMTA